MDISEEHATEPLSFWRPREVASLEHSYGRSPYRRPRCCSKRCRLVAGCSLPPCWALCCCIFGLGFVTELFQPEPLKTAGGALLFPDNLTTYLQWPGCAAGPKSTWQLQQCASTPCGGAKLLQVMANFNGKHPARLVHFPSRPGPDGQNAVNLTAWWMPPPVAAGSEQQPRILVQHGYGGNFNDWSVQLVAFMLRSLGYGVLATNLRNHGSSDRFGSGYCTWGWAQPYDVLGAWDFAVIDPTGELGGALPPEKVGMLGLSMGGFLTSIAFGMEERVPAAWVDSGVFDPKLLMLATLQRYLGPLEWPLAPISLELAWRFAQWWSGASDLDYNSPKVTLSSGGNSKKRPVALVYNFQDTLVTMEEERAYGRLFEGMRDRYEVLEILRSSTCGGETHLVNALRYPEEYKDALFSFWGLAFGGDARPAAAATSGQREDR